MITINYNGKTYTTKEYTQGDTIIGAHVRNWIKKGFLEEVKENKELMEDDTLESIKEFEEYEQSIKDTSILKKLREELERREKEHRDCENELSEFSLGVWQAECEILALLTSLEQPKEETSKSNIPSREELDKMAIPEWTPTPGQMIEVSNDREKWEDRPRKFVCLVGSDHFRAFGPTI